MSISIIKKQVLTILFSILAQNLLAQNIPLSTFEKDDYVYLRYSNKNYKIGKGENEANSKPELSSNKKYLAYFITDLELETSTPTIGLYNISTNTIDYILKSSTDGEKGGTKISYRNTSIYPFKVLMEILNFKFNSDGTKIIFETYAWRTSNAVHIYDIKTKKIKLVCAGTLNSALPNGNFNISISGIDSRGRWFCDAEVNSNGKIIKYITVKIY